jgi:hypothetical protein
MDAKKSVMNLADAITSYSMVCGILSHLGSEILKKGKHYKDLSDDEIGVVIRHIITSSNSRNEVHRRIISELKIDNFSIQSLCPPKHSSSKKNSLSTGAMTTKDGTMIVVTITDPKGEMIMI